MRRRDFIGALLLTPMAGSANAQHSAGMKHMALAEPAGRITDMRIGGDSAYTIGFQELQRLGFIEGKNLIVERYSADGNRERYADLARDVVKTRPDVISTSGTPMTQALMAATNIIPIVTITGDPIRLGLVSSISRPGGNVTGVSVDAGLSLWGKRLELLVEAVPQVRTVLFVATQAGWDAAGGQATRETAQKLGISLVLAPVSIPINEEALRRTFEEIARDKADGLMFAVGTEFYAHRLLIVELVRQVGLPAIYGLREQTEVGGLIAYSDDINQAFRLQAQQIAEILHGKNPAEMPYVQASKYELVINLKTAKALGLEISPALLARADAVIE